LPHQTDTSADASAHDLTKPAASWSGRRHLLDTKDLTIEEVKYLVESAKKYKALRATRKPLPAVAGSHILANLFYENSTRTRSSFELAGKALGMTVLNLDIGSSSVAKGETIEDTARTLLAMGVDIIVQRHSTSGSAGLIAEKFGKRLHVVNAGDGTNAHPTQGLLDLFTMFSVEPNLKGKKVAIVGDVTYSRVARSDIWLLQKFGADIHVVGPPSLIPDNLKDQGITVHHNIEDALNKADFIIALRLQLERQKAGLIASFEEYSQLYRLDHKRIAGAKPNVKVLHPGPINRGIEITDELADDLSVSLIDEQVSNGVAIRMAVLDAIAISE
jgi:aspartate carbamoyltransferase catalytic subunit